MVALLAAVIFILIFLVLIQRYRVREQRKELLIMRRHAGVYAEEHKLF